MTAAALLLVLGTDAACLGSPHWHVRAEAQAALCEFGPWGRLVAGCGVACPDPEVRWRCGEVLDGRLPRVRVCPGPWEEWPVGRMR